MKRKGFTLVELLAVIVVLAIISIITIPMIGNVIDESKKKALEVSANGLVEAANYFTISNDGVYEFVFDENKKGETIKGEQLDYKGSIEGTGKLYIDQEGDISLCLVDDKYYVYKNYNSGIYVGEVKDNSCIIGYDVLTNKYVAMLDDGTGQISNVYSKEEVNNLIDSVRLNVTNNTNEITSIKENINTLTTTVDNNTNIITTNTNEISNMKGTIETLQSNLSNYALKSSLNTTNDNLNSLSSIVNSNTSSISELNSNLSTIGTIYTSNTVLITNGTNERTNYDLMELTLPKGKYIATFAKRIDEFTSDGRIFPYIYNSGHMYSGSKPNESSSSGFSFTYAFELWQETTVKAGIHAELAWSTNNSYGLFQAIRIG